MRACRAVAGVTRGVGRHALRSRASVPLAWVLIGLVSDPAQGEWLPTGNAVSASPGNQAGLNLRADGSGGVLVSWTQSRPFSFLDPDTSRVRLIQLTADGTVAPGWPTVGMEIEPNTIGQALSIVSTTPGGDIVVAWMDIPGNPDNPRGSRLQRLKPWGTIVPGWPASGVTLGANQAAVRGLDVGGDGSIVAVWAEFPRQPGEYDVGVQRVDSSPGPSFPWGFRGVLMDTTARYDDLAPRVVADDEGGACVVWRNLDGDEALARKLDSSGAPSQSWPPGEHLIGRSGNTASSLQVAKDSLAGLYVTWSDARSGLGEPRDGDIYLSRLRFDTGSDPSFPLGGLRICGATDAQVTPRVAVVGSDAVIVWADRRDSVSFDIYAQRVTRVGTIAPGWPSDGVLVAGGLGDQTDPVLVASSADSVWIAWRDRRSDTGDIYLQKLDGSGAPAPGWPTGGRRVGPGPLQQSNPVIVTDGFGGAFVGWSEIGSTSEGRSFVTRITASGEAGSEIPTNPPPSSLRFLHARPNPSRSSQLLVFDLPVASGVVVEILDVSGRLRRTIGPTEVLTAGERGIVWDGTDQTGRRLPRGVYLARILAGTAVTNGKLVLLD